MFTKSVAHAIVWLVVMFCLAKAIEVSDVVGVYVEGQVETGKVAAVGAPRMALSIEYGAAGLVAFLIASSAPGIAAANWLAGKIDLLVAKFKVASTANVAPDGARPLTTTDLDIIQLARVLRDLRALAKDAQNRLTTLEKAAFGVKPDGSPAEPSAPDEQPIQGEATISVSSDDLSDQVKKAIADAVAEAMAAQPAPRRTRSARQA